jgi:hypothetical protein
MPAEVRPLLPAMWFERIDTIARGELGSVENALRHASHLLQLTPTQFREVVHGSLDEDAFEALLDAGELDTAARHLIAQPTALSVEEDADGRVQAVISCVILRRAIRGTGDTVATAVLDAWTTCLLALRTEFGADLASLTEESLPTHQSRWRGPLSRH